MPIEVYLRLKFLEFRYRLGDERGIAAVLSTSARDRRGYQGPGSVRASRIRNPAG